MIPILMKFSGHETLPNGMIYQDFMDPRKFRWMELMGVGALQQIIVMRSSGVSEDQATIIPN